MVPKGRLELPRSSTNKGLAGGVNALSTTWRDKMIKYKTGEWNILIKEVEVERETDVSVWVNGRRCGKRTSWDNYFDTWAKAYSFLFDRATHTLEAAERRLESAKEQVAKIEALVDPTQ